MKTGPEQLKDWMHRRRFLQREAAEHLGWHEAYISQLLNGHRVPGLDNAVEIERKTGIPVEAWVASELANYADDGAADGPKRRHSKA